MIAVLSDEACGLGKEEAEEARPSMDGGAGTLKGLRAHRVRKRTIPQMDRFNMRDVHAGGEPPAILPDLRSQVCIQPRQGCSG